MKKLLIIIIFLWVGKFCFAQMLEVDTAIPQFTSVDIYGKQISAEELKGKVVIISIAHFDQVRKRSESNSPEIKELNDFYSAYRDKGLEVVRIASKRGVPFFVSKSFVEGRARQMCKRNKDNLSVIIDWDRSLKGLLKMNDEPVVFIVDRSGIIRYRKNGLVIFDNKVTELIQKLL